MGHKSYEQLAKSAYEAHAKELHRRIGVNAPTWDKVQPSDRECWIAAAKQVAAELALVH